MRDSSKYEKNQFSQLNMDDNSTLQKLKDRKPVKWRCCLISWLFSKHKKEEQLLGKGSGRITKEFDVIRYIKRSMMLDIAFKTLFTKTDRYLLQNNKAFILQHKGKKSSDDSSSTDWEPELPYNYHASPYQRKLLEDVTDKIKP